MWQSDIPFLRSKHRDIVAEVCKCGSRGLDLIFPVLYLTNIFTAVRARMSTSRGIYFCFIGFLQPRKYHTIRNVVFVVFTQTDCRSCSVDPKMHHPAKRSLAMCEQTGGVLCYFVAVSHCYICHEHSLIGLRNCLMTEAASSLSATAGLRILSPI